MNFRKSLLIIPLFLPLVASCSGNNNNSQFDPFMIGDNLEVIAGGEAELISNEAYDNLMYTSSLRKSITDEQDDTKFYTGAFSSYGTHKKTTNESEVIYYANKIETNRNIVTTTYLGTDSTVENRNTQKTDWYGIKPVKEGETPSSNYSLLTKTIEKYNGISSTRYSSEDDFSSKDNVNPLWKRYIVNSISDTYLRTSISYSSNFTYVRDNQHILGYLSMSNVTTENSKIAPGKDDASYLKKTEYLVVIDFYKDDMLGVGWTVKSVSTREIITYLTTIDGKETDPLEVSRQVDVTSFNYDLNPQKSEDIPTFELGNARKFSISRFVFNEEHTALEYASKYELEDNDDFYRHIEDGFNGHAYYKEQKLEIGFYSFFDGEPEDPKEYEKWGYKDIIENKCVNYIVDPKDAKIPDTDKEVVLTHNKLFYVAAPATFSFRVVFNSDMSQTSEFSVAIVGR